MSEVVTKDGVFTFTLEPVMYKGEPWFSCKIYLGEYGLIAHGRKPERALAFAMQALADAALKGRLVVPAWETPSRGEVLDATE